MANDKLLQDIQTKCKGKKAEILGEKQTVEKKKKKRDRNDRIKDSWSDQ